MYLYYYLVIRKMDLILIFCYRLLPLGVEQKIRKNVKPINRIKPPNLMYINISTNLPIWVAEIKF